jgi:hypothetical protein
MSYVFGSLPGDTERFITGHHIQEPFEFTLPYKAARSYTDRVGQDRSLLLGVIDDTEFRFESSAADRLYQARHQAQSEGRLIIADETQIPYDIQLIRKGLGARLLDYVVNDVPEEQSKALIVPTIKTFRYLSRLSVRI